MTASVGYSGKLGQEKTRDLSKIRWGISVEELWDIAGIDSIVLVSTLVNETPRSSSKAETCPILHDDHIP
jgi:hypothetical protein